MLLTERELEAAELIAGGASRSILSEQLSISLSTVDKLLRALKTKLNVDTGTQLVVAASGYMRQHRDALNGPTTGAILARPLSDGSKPALADFAGATDFDALFDLLHVALEPFGITHLTYSRIRRRDPDGIEHMSTRWSFSESIGFDMSIPPEEHLTFKHAMVSWKPTPLDLEDMMASDAYSYVPANIRAQNDVYVAAGLVRGITYILPGCNLDERFVLSVLMRGMDRDTFQTVMRTQIDPIGTILSAFRNAHMGFAAPAIRLQPREEDLMKLLSDGLSMDEAAARIGISRRATDRLLSAVRTAFGRDTNLSAMAAYHRNRANPVLPF